MPPARQPDQSAPTTVSPTGVGYEGPKDGRDPRGQAGDELTTPNGVRLPDSDHSLKAGPRGPVLLRTSTCARRSCTSTTSASRSAWCTPAAPARTASSPPTARPRR